MLFPKQCQHSSNSCHRPVWLTIFGPHRYIWAGWWAALELCPALSLSGQTEGWTDREQREGGMDRRDRGEGKMDGWREGQRDRRQREGRGRWMDGGRDGQTEGGTDERGGEEVKTCSGRCISDSKFFPCSKVLNLQNFPLKTRTVYKAVLAVLTTWHWRIPSVLASKECTVWVTLALVVIKTHWLL